MAESAFGIDHGDISKAGFKMPGSFRPSALKPGGMVKPKIQAAGGKLQAAGQKSLQSGTRRFVGNQGGSRMQMGAARTQNMAGRGMQRMGASMQANPNRWAGGAAAGAAAGGGYLAFGRDKKRF